MNPWATQPCVSVLSLVLSETFFKTLLSLEYPFLQLKEGWKATTYLQAFHTLFLKKYESHSSVAARITMTNRREKSFPTNHLVQDVRRALTEEGMNNFFRPAPQRQKLPRTIKQSFHRKGQGAHTHSCLLSLTWIPLTGFAERRLPGRVPTRDWHIKNCSFCW